jgi:hypothetical protein
MYSEESGSENLRALALKYDHSAVWNSLVPGRSVTKSYPILTRNSLLPFDKSNRTGLPMPNEVVGVHTSPSFEHMSTNIAMPALNSRSDKLLKNCILQGMVKC